MMADMKDQAELRNFDQVRHHFCAQLAPMIRAGIDGFLVRFVQHDGSSSDCWIYSYEQHQWHKRNEVLREREAIKTLFEDFEGLCHRDISDTWNCRRVDHGQHIDFELKFKHDKLEAHRSGDIESFLLGTLFGSHHDTGVDSRRRIQFRRSSPRE